MVSVADIKKDLPSWPDDVIAQWLTYFANWVILLLTFSDHQVGTGMRGTS
jgi:hypothetical protein